MKKFIIKTRKLDGVTYYSFVTYEKSFEKAYKVAKLFVHHQKKTNGVEHEILKIEKIEDL